MLFKTIDDIQIGETETFTKTISEADVYLFAGITGDLNPIHIDSEYAKSTHFKQRIAHGVLINGLMSTVIGTKLPGPGCILSSYSLKFNAPVYFGDTVTATVAVIEKNVNQNRLKLEANCHNQVGKLIANGEFIVLPFVKTK